MTVVLVFVALAVLESVDHRTGVVRRLLFPS